MAFSVTFLVQSQRGDAVVLPSVVKIEMCDPTPASTDIPYWQLWQEQWHELDIDKIRETWGRQ